MDFLTLPYRTTGSRKYGLTSVIDLGIPLEALESILKNYGDFIDIAKIGIGTAYVTPNIKEKINLYKEYEIKPYFGGTLFEKCYYQNKLPEYIQSLQKLGIEWIEVSSGTIDIPIEERIDFITELQRDFFVIAEVGSKDANNEMTTDKWKKEIQLLLDVGCEYVITEGRDSGTSGIYEKNGTVKTDLIEELFKDIDVKKVIFEAPTPKQQMYFINQFGANVNLGNVKLSDVLVLETQRCGLRCETFYLDDQNCKLHV